MVFDEFANLAAALADHADHHDIGLGMPRHHPQQRRLADAAAREKADTHAAAHGGERIDGADAYIKRRVDPRSVHRVQRYAKQGPRLRYIGGRFAVERNAAAVDYTP